MTVVLTASEVLTLMISRELRDGDRVHIGANQELVLDAVILATAVAGTRVALTAGGGSWFDEPERALGLITYGRTTVELFDAPLDQERAFDDLNRPPIVFAGGIQVDRSGNVNLIGVGRTELGWKVRGPGSAGLPSLTGLSSTYYAYTARHDQRTLVPEVEYISAVGSPSLRERYGLPEIDRFAVFTPLGRFTREEGTLALSALAPGVTPAEVIAATSFPLAGDPHKAPTITPTDEEISWFQGRENRTKGSTHD